MADHKIAIRLVADGDAFIGEVRLAADALESVTEAANDAGDALQDAGRAGNVADLAAFRAAIRGATSDLAGLSERTRALQQASAGAGQGLTEHRERLAATGREAANTNQSTGALTGGLNLLRGGMAALAGIGVATTLKEIGTEAISARRETEQLTVRLSGLTTGAAELAETQEYLAKTARTLSADQVTLTESYTQLLNLRKADLLTTEQARKLLEGFSNIQAATGASTEQLGQTMYGLSQALASGVVRAEEFNQITEPLPGLMQALDKAAGQMSGGFRRLVNDGKVTSSLFRDTLVKALDEYAGAAERTSNTIVAAETRWKNSRQALLDMLGRKLQPAYQAGVTAAADTADALVKGDKNGQDFQNVRLYTEAFRDLVQTYKDLKAARDAYLDVASVPAGPARNSVIQHNGEIFAQTQELEAKIATLEARVKELAAATGRTQVVDTSRRHDEGSASTTAKLTADQATAFDEAAKKAGYLRQQGQLLREEEAELATATTALNAIVKLSPAELAKFGISARSVGVVLDGLKQKLDPLAAAVAALSRELDLLKAPAGLDRDLLAAWQNAQTGRAREIDFGEKIQLDTAVQTNRATALATENRQLALKETLERRAAAAQGQGAAAQADAARLTTLAGKAQEVYGIAAAEAVVKAGGMTPALRAQYPVLAQHADALRKVDYARIGGEASAAATGLSVQARQARELAAATRESGAAAWEAATRHKIENETRAAGVAVSSELAARVRDEAEAQRELAQAQWDRDLDTQIAAAQALAAAEGQGAEAVALATIATQAAAQAEKEGVAADSERAKAIGAKMRALAEWQQRQGAAAAGRQADDDLVLTRAEIRLQGAGAAVRERTLYLLKEEQAIRREFPLLSEAERKALLEKKALVYDTAAALKEQQALYEAIGSGLSQAFDRVGSAITEAFAQGKVGALDFRSIARATFSELVQLALRLAVINPVKNWITGGSEASLWSALAGGGATSTSAAGQTAGAGSAVSSSLTNAAMSKAGGWALDKLGVTGSLTSALDAWGYSTLGIGSASYGPTMAGAHGMLTGGGATSAAAPTITGGLSAYLGAAGAGALGGGLLGGWAGTAANSKAVGAGVGAVAGAGSAYLASVVGLSSLGGPVGLAIGAVVGAIMGALGTAKKGAGPGAAIDYVYGQDGSRDYQTYTRKGETDERVKAIGETLAGTLDLLRQAGGSLNGPVSWHYGYNQRDGVGSDVNGRPFSAEADPDKWAQAVLRQLQAEGSLSFGTGAALVKKAFGGALSTAGNSLEDVVKGVALAKSIADASAGLDSVDKSFQALASSAKTTAAAQYDAVKAELEVAKKAGIAEEYRALVERQLRAAFDPAAAATQAVSSTGAALAALDGEMQALADAVTALGLSISAAELEAWKAAKAADVRRHYDDGLTAALNAARGKDYLNAADTVAAALKAVRQEINDLYSSADRSSRWATAVETNRLSAQKVIDDNALTGTGYQEFLQTFTSSLKEAGLAADDIARLTEGLHESSAAVEADTQRREDLQRRELAARVALGEATQQQLTAYDREVARRRGLAAVSGDLARAAEGALLDLEDRAAAATALTERWQSATASRSGGVAGLSASLAAASAQYTADAAIDGAKALDILRASVTALVDGLSDSDATLAQSLRMSSAVSGTAAQALADALAARQAATQETAWAARQSEATEVLASRVTTARSAYLDALTREQATLRDTASRLREVGASLSALRASLALDSTLSPLSPQARLAEAKRQLQAAVEEFRASGDDAAGTKAQQLMDSYLRASRDYNSSAPAYQADYDWVVGLTTELEGLATTTASAKDAQARALDATVAALGGTTSAVLSLTDALARYTEAVRLSGNGAGAQDFGAADVASDNRVVAAATAQSGNGYTGAFRDGAFAQWAESTYAAHANDQGVGASVNAMLRASTGYTGDFAGGAFVDYVRSSAVSELQREAARSILRRNNVVPQFEAGGWHDGGARIVGERGIELEVTGAARYYSHDQTRDLLSPRPAADLTPLVAAVNSNAITISRAVAASGEAVTLAIGQLAAQVAGMSQEVADLRRTLDVQSRIIQRLAA